MSTSIYKGWTIEKFTHPKLAGKYSIFDKEGIEVCRAGSIKEAKAIIKSEILYSKIFTKYVSKWKNKYFDDDSEWEFIEITRRYQRADILKEIRKLLSEGYRVETGYICTKIRGVHDRFIFYKNK